MGVKLLVPQLDESIERNEENFLEEWLGSYNPFFYHVMLLDTARMTSYETGIPFATPKVKQAAAKSGGRASAVWLDVGCGHNLPLTQMVLATGEAEHVHAIEGNEAAFAHIDRLLAAKTELQRRVTVHRALSSDVELGPDARGDALIHEVIGVVASDEGMMSILADAQDRLLVDRAEIFPSFIATIAVVTGPLEVTAATLVGSRFARDQTSTNLSFFPTPSPVITNHLERHTAISVTYRRLHTGSGTPQTGPEFYPYHTPAVLQALELLRQQRMPSRGGGQAVLV
jgi:hypothetical protein